MVAFQAFGPFMVARVLWFQGFFVVTWLHMVSWFHGYMVAFQAFGLFIVVRVSWLLGFYGLKGSWRLHGYTWFHGFMAFWVSSTAMAFWVSSTAIFNDV